MRLGFFVNANNISQECLDDLSSNQGMGGTEYLTFVLIKTLLSTRKDVEVFLYTNKVTFSFTGINILLASNAAEAALLFDSDYGLFVGNFSIKKEVPASLLKKARIIIWGHHFFNKDLAKYIGKREDVYKVVFLTKAVQSYYYLYKIYSSCVIEHFYSSDNTFLTDFKTRDNVVCYIGSLFSFKNCHVLLDNWSKIRKQVPNAKLFIIGSAKLYDKNIKLGERGIAEPDYEKRLFKNVNSEDLSSIYFKGLCTQEQIDSILQCVKVGVVNPLGTTETFCLSAFDFARNKIPVVTARYGGLINTVTNKFGHLTLSNYRFRKSIISILKKSDNKKGVLYSKYVSTSFSYDNFKNKWINLIFQSFETKNKRCLLGFLTFIFYYMPTKYIIKIRHRLNR